MNQVQRVRAALVRLEAIERVYKAEAALSSGEKAKRQQGTASGVAMSIREVRHALSKSDSAIANWGV